MAERVGFEPTVCLHIQRFSSSNVSVFGIAFCPQRYFSSKIQHQTVRPVLFCLPSFAGFVCIKFAYLVLQFNVLGFDLSDLCAGIDKAPFGNPMSLILLNITKSGI